MMTRKHFQKTADILNARIRTCLVSVDGVNIPGLILPEMAGEYAQLTSLADEFADWFADDNPSFNRERFMQAAYRCN
jgi:hypothetical protein